jgi:hypothetical protein
MKAIRTKYIPASNLKPAYYKATDQDKKTAKISASTVDSADDGHRKAAEALRYKMKWSGRMVQGGLSKSEEVFVFVDGLNELIEQVEIVLASELMPSIITDRLEKNLKIVKAATGEK